MESALTVRCHFFGGAYLVVVLVYEYEVFWHGEYERVNIGFLQEV